MKTFFFFFLLVQVSLFFSCKNLSNSTMQAAEEQKVLNTKYINDSIEFENNIKSNILNRNKLYLDFWLNMSEKEFLYVCHKLVNQNVLFQENDIYQVPMTFERVEQVYYSSIAQSLSTGIAPIVKTKFWLEPNFTNDSLRAMKLNIELRHIGELKGIKIGNSVYSLFGPTLVSPITEANILDLFKSKYGNPSRSFINDYQKTGVIGDWKEFTWILNDKVIQISIVYNSFSYGKSLLEGGLHDIMKVINILSITYKDLDDYNKEIESQNANKQKLKNDIENKRNVI